MVVMVEINASAGAGRLSRITIKCRRYATRPVRSRLARIASPARDWSQELRLQLVTRLMRGASLPEPPDEPAEARKPEGPAHRKLRD